MNLFYREWKTNCKSLLLWSLGIFLMIAGGMSKYAAASKSGQSIAEVIRKMPPSIQALFGVGTFDLSQAIGFYGVIFLFLSIMAAIHSSLLGATIISKEERDKTSEFLFSKPITRRRIISQKISIAVILVILLNLITLFSSLWLVDWFNKGESVNMAIVKLVFGMGILQFIFLSLGFGISAISKNARSAPSKVSSLLLFFFLLNRVVVLNQRLSFLRFFTPFSYFDAGDLMNKAGFNPMYLLLSVLIITLLLILTYALYEKRDLAL